MLKKKRNFMLYRLILYISYIIKNFFSVLSFVNFLSISLLPLFFLKSHALLFFQFWFMNTLKHRKYECVCLHVHVSSSVNNCYYFAIFALIVCHYFSESFESKLHVCTNLSPLSQASVFCHVSWPASVNDHGHWCYHRPQRQVPQCWGGEAIVPALSSYWITKSLTWCCLVVRWYNSEIRQRSDSWNQLW